MMGVVFSILRKRYQKSIDKHFLRFYDLINNFKHSNISNYKFMAFRQIYFNV